MVPDAKSSAITMPGTYRLRDVDVAVDPARQDELARYIDDLAGFAQIVAKGDNAAAADADVAAEGVGRRRDRAAA